MELNKNRRTRCASISEIKMIQMRLRSWAGPIALAVCLFPPFLAAEPLPDNRQSVRAIMAQHPDDPEIQQAGQRALDALDALDAALSRGTRVDMPPAELAGQPAGATVTGPSAFPNPMEGLDSWNIDRIIGAPPSRGKTGRSITTIPAPSLRLAGATASIARKRIR